MACDSISTLNRKDQLRNVRTSLHDASLDLSNDSVITAGELHSRHLCNTESNSLALRGHQHYFFVHLNASLYK